MRAPRVFLGTALITSCVASGVEDRPAASGAPVEEARIAPDGSSEQGAAADTWGQIIEAPPEVFCAADLSDDVRNGLTDTLLAATAVWGNYGPLEYWVLGTDPEAARDLAELFCARRLQLGHWDESDHLNQQMATGGDHGFESYRRTGVDAVANGVASTSMGWSGNRDWGIHLYMSSYPLGFDKRFGSSPGGEQITVFHEYFHAVQQAHIQTRDHEERMRRMGPMWFIEGGADYMAQTTARMLWASGELPTIDNGGPGSLEQCFENKMTSGKNTIASNSPGVRLGDITYESDCASAGYDLGCWAIAYLLNRSGPSALLETFFPLLDELGWEGAFRRTFGMSSEVFYDEFDTFLTQPRADQLAILPECD